MGQGDRERLLAAIEAAIPGLTPERAAELLLGTDGGRTALDLRERVKELTAFHAAAALLEDESVVGPELLERLAALLPPAFRFAEDAVGRVSLGPVARATPGWEETPRILRSAFRTADGSAGTVEVAYLHDHPAAAEGPFLAEERSLLDSLARLIEVGLNRRRAEERFRIIVGTGQVRLFEWDIVRDHYYFPGVSAEAVGADAPPLGITRAEVDRRIHPEDLPAFRRRVDAALADPKRALLTAEYRTALLPDQYTWRHLLGVVVRDREGVATRLIGISTDISEQKHLEGQLRQNQRLEALGQLAGGVAHDFNNILSAILGYADLAANEVPPGTPARKYLDEVGKAGRTAAALVKQILAFGRRQELRPRAVDLPKAIEDMRGMLTSLVQRRVVLKTECEPDARAALVDPNQFQQVVMNLCVNARDAMPRGGTITLRVRRLSKGAPREDGEPGEPRDWTALEVEDTGTGMPPEVRDRIFEPFFTTKAEGKGTGLGLATVHGIVRQSGGFLELESEVGEGTLFRAFFPEAV